MTNATPTAAPEAFAWQNGLRYGAMGLPLAFVALPLYVLLPNHYATQFGVPLAVLGAVLLLARLFDALIDPLLGRWVDALYARSTSAVLRMATAGTVVLCTGVALLFGVPDGVRDTPLLVWLSAALLITYASYSAVSVAHQAWAARLGGSDAQRSRIVSWREGLGLLGVVLASVLPSAVGYLGMVVALCIASAIAVALWLTAQKPESSLSDGTQFPLGLPFGQRAFRWLFAVFVLNGIASAVPATLLLFFVQDRLQAPAGAEGPLLAAYFVCAAASLPLWLKTVARLGLERTWLAGMGLAIAVFVWAAALGQGDMAAFAAVCALSGVALGADLAVPSALLARVIAQRTDSGAGAVEGIYFGWWNFAAKLNLALAAGLALPLLAWFGYTPGARSTEALHALTVAYCLLPCVLKAAAGTVLFAWLRRSKGPLA